MSHSNYAFLLYFDAEVLMSTSKEKIERISKTFEDRFGLRLDSNNWFAHLAAFFKDGTFCVWPGKEPGRFARVPKEKRWDEVMRYVIQCIAFDFNLYGTRAIENGGERNSENQQIYTATSERLVYDICRRIPKRLAKIYEALGEESDFPYDYAWLEEASRRKTVLMYEAFRRSVHPPFTEWLAVTPYEYRAFDLTYGMEANTILISDIHT